MWISSFFPWQFQVVHAQDTSCTFICFSHPSEDGWIGVGSKEDDLWAYWAGFAGNSFMEMLS